MSSGLEPFALTEGDVMKFLACKTAIGTANVDHQMKQYTHSRRFDGK